MHYRDFLALVAQRDVSTLEQKDREYGGSWLKRGGVGAFMMLARKWDRIEQAMTKDVALRTASGPDMVVAPYDVITRAICDGREEGLLDDIGDLRRYLLLVESEIRCKTSNRDAAAGQGAPAEVEERTCYGQRLDPFERDYRPGPLGRSDNPSGSSGGPGT